MVEKLIVVNGQLWTLFVREALRGGFCMSIRSPDGTLLDVPRAGAFQTESQGIAAAMAYADALISPKGRVYGG